MKDKIIYFNMRGSYGVETIDEYSKSEFDSWNSKSQKPYKSFMAYVREMLRCTIESGSPAYMSCRCTKDWRNK